MLEVSVFRCFGGTKQLAAFVIQGFSTTVLVIDEVAQASILSVFLIRFQTLLGIVELSTVTTLVKRADKPGVSECWSCCHDVGHLHVHVNAMLSLHACCTLLAHLLLLRVLLLLLLLVALRWVVHVGVRDVHSCLRVAWQGQDHGMHDAFNSGGAGGLFPVCKSTSCNQDVCSQGPTRRKGSTGGVSGSAEDLLPVSKVEAGVIFSAGRRCTGAGCRFTS